MPTEKVQLTKENETLLATLYARALESRSADPILRDEMAEEAVRTIDHDFEHLKVDVLAIVMRAKQFDMWTTQFLTAHPDAIVVQLGCSLDSRVYRINAPASVRWYDIDFPEIIELRQQLYPEKAGYYMIGSSLADLEWLDMIPQDQPAWIIVDGVTMYLSKEIMNTLLQRVTNHFPSGGLAFDAISSAAFRMANRNQSITTTGAAFGGWHVDDPLALKQVAPKLELVGVPRTPQLPGYTKLPWTMRALVQVFDFFPNLRMLSRLFLYRF